MYGEIYQNEKGYIQGISFHIRIRLYKTESTGFRLLLFKYDFVGSFSQISLRLLTQIDTVLNQMRHLIMVYVNKAPFQRYSVYSA